MYEKPPKVENFRGFSIDPIFFKPKESDYMSFPYTFSA